MADNAQTLAARYIKAKRALFDKAYSSLNSNQREAVFSVNGPLLVLAGAGSGKTTVLVRRVAFIIKYGNAYFDETVPAGIDNDRVTALENAAVLEGNELSEILSEFIVSPCPPWAMMAITFTNKAANEIKTRLSTAFEGQSAADEIWAGTFHAVCMRILRRDGERIGLARGFSVYDTDDQKKLVADCMKVLDIDPALLPVKTVMNAIGRAKDKLTGPEEFEKEAGLDVKALHTAKVYREYQARLESSNALDFDDIIMKTVKLLQTDEEVRRYYQNRFRYVCIDEFQDTNAAQLALCVLLSGKYRNLMVVGDDDQSIYKFRGATIENILRFDSTFEDAKIVKLEQNYRSTSNILDAANSVIKNNIGRRGKDLWTDAGQGDKILVRRLHDQNEEARFIINKIMDLVIREKRRYRDFALLYRVNAQGGSVESVFAKSGIPYRVLGGQRFFDRKEIRDIAAYLHLIANPADNMRLKRIINEPKRKIGGATIAAIEDLSAELGISMFEVCGNAEAYTLISKSASKLRDFCRMINDLRTAAPGITVHELIDRTAADTGYMRMLEEEGEEGKDRIDNLSELVTSALEYEKRNTDPTLDGFLEEIALVSDVDKYDENADAVVLMTVHSAKGLEFPIVFLPGMEDGIFPGQQSMYEPGELEEERRLAYVALTRAKEKLIITYTAERTLYGKTAHNPVSRFVKEIPQELLDAAQTEAKPTEQPRTERPVYEGRRQKVQISKEFYQKSSLAGGVGRTADIERFDKGDRVSHITFGTGTIVSASEMGPDIMYVIDFDKAGTKKLMATYAKLKKAEE